VGIEAIMALAGLVVPPAADFIKKKFLKKGEDTTDATVNSLATTSPEVIPSFIQAKVELLRANIEWFNRDYKGTVSVWVNDLRASIRPVTVILSIGIIALDNIAGMSLDEQTRGALLMNITSWFSDRIK